MNGPQHAMEAERILEQSKRELARATPETINEIESSVKLSLEFAKVHAFLAVAKRGDLSCNT